ncbi:hypothetical protein LCGC14_1215010 [marine sediment metagenome]|uniref:Uncharacterized protein n=1 Tax=marine sediment metagenome TaxID=412755 RepID=A0A0F9NVB2_9ZZZZ
MGMHIATDAANETIYYSEVEWNGQKLMLASDEGGCPHFYLGTLECEPGHQYCLACGGSAAVPGERGK